MKRKNHLHCIRKTFLFTYFNIDLLMTIRCTSLVPSYIWVIFASRINLST